MNTYNVYGRKQIDTEMVAPPSKAHTLRAIFIASLADGISKINNPLLAEDQLLAIEALKELGVKIENKNNQLIIHGTGGKLKAPNKELYLGNSGVSVRTLATMLSLTDGKTTITGDEKMQESRPITDLTDALKPLGIKIDNNGKNGCIPIIIHGNTFKGGVTELKGDKSSQYFSSILMSAPFAKNTVTIKTVGEISSKPYIDLTIDVMKDFGVEVTNNDYKEFIIQPGKYIAQEYQIEGDYSNASYFFGAAAIFPGKIKIKKINPNSNQGDKFFLEALLKMGCNIEFGKDFIQVVGPKKLLPIEADMNSCPDIVPSLAVVAAFAKGTSKFTNIAHLKYKETDRLNAVAKELEKMGITTETTNDSLIVHGGEPKLAIIETYNDHRMAMSFAMAGIKVHGLIIKNPECVQKSFPDFWKKFERL